MGAIGGWSADWPPSRLERACRATIGAQSAWGRETRLSTLPGGVLAATGALPARAIASRGGRCLVADARLDNRDELCSAARLSPRLTEPELLLGCFERWGLDALDKLVGDFALALFDSEKRELLLARDAIGARPLFFARTNGAVAFASMPSGLFAMPELWRGFDFNQLARRLTQPFADDAKSYWRGISKVLPGEAVLFRGAGEIRTRYWNPPLGPSDDPRHDPAGELRALLDAAVACRIRDQRGVIAAQPSGGLDSGAVVATAARLRSHGQRIVAFTSAPRAGFDVPVENGFLSDETALADETARMHHVEHVIVRPEPTDVVAQFRSSARLYQEAIRNVHNEQWLRQILRLSREAGAEVLLSGAMGNLSLTAGKVNTLQEWVMRGDWRTWLREARWAIGSNSYSWRGVLLNSFGPLLPSWLWKGLHRRFLGVADPLESSFIRREWAQSASLEPADWAVPKPGRSSYADRLRMIRAYDPGLFHHGGLAEAGIDERDPTADRRLVEFSLRLPPQMLFHRGRNRFLAREALSDRLPDSVAACTARGLQSADWFERLRAKDARSLLDLVESSSAAVDFLDLAAMKRAIDCWPSGNWRDPRVQGTYGTKLPLALSVGVFLAECEAMAGTATNGAGPARKA